MACKTAVGNGALPWLFAVSVLSTGCEVGALAGSLWERLFSRPESLCRENFAAFVGATDIPGRTAPAWLEPHPGSSLLACEALSRHDAGLCDAAPPEFRHRCRVEVERAQALSAGVASAWLFTATEAEDCLSTPLASSCAAFSTVARTGDLDSCPGGPHAELCRALFTLDEGRCGALGAAGDGTAVSFCRSEIAEKTAWKADFLSNRPQGVSALRKAIAGEPEACEALLTASLRPCVEGAKLLLPSFGFARRSKSFARALIDSHYLDLDEEARAAQPVTTRTLTWMALRPGLEVADVGAGIGFFTSRMAPAVAPGGRIIATEIDRPLVAALALRAQQEGHSNVEVRHVHSDAMGLAPGSIDRMLVYNVYLFDEAPLEAVKPWLAAAHAALRPGGRIVMHQDWSHGRVGRQGDGTVDERNGKVGLAELVDAAAPLFRVRFSERTTVPEGAPKGSAGYLLVLDRLE